MLELMFMKAFFKILILIVIFVSGFGASLAYLLGAPSKSDEEIIFIVPKDQLEFDIVESLGNRKLIKSEKAFNFLFNNFTSGISVLPGGYKLSPNMNAWEVVNKIKGKPDLYWLTISACLRKEQIGEILQETLGWNDDQLTEWNSLYKDTKTDYYEGVYYPDTYLLPVSETPKQIADRFINHFNEKIAPLLPEYASKNIKWTTGLKIASLLGREAAGKDDMKIISGVIWNRLNSNMALQIDATMQYTLGKQENGKWWGGIDISQKQSDSPYNSYKTKKLPPTPICSPNIDLIEATLNPAETDCIFYLHDKGKEIHCAETYAEHLRNIETYLR